MSTSILRRYLPRNQRYRSSLDIIVTKPASLTTEASDCRAVLELRQEIVCVRSVILAYLCLHVCLWATAEMSCYDHVFHYSELITISSNLLAS
jgi:hypothetical protein